MFDSDEDDTIYAVVMNHEEQYSIWPTQWPVPNGWTDTGVSGLRRQCLDHIDMVWTDMRPLSLRRAMAADLAADLAGGTPADADAVVDVTAEALSGR